MNPFQHVDLRVNDLQRAWEFYSRVLPAIGFTDGHRGSVYSGFESDGRRPQRAWFGFTADSDHRPNRTRIAFWAASREQVEAIAALLGPAGALNVSGPKAMPEYDASYYAVFFEDPFGNCLEVCHLEG